MKGKQKKRNPFSFLPPTSHSHCLISSLLQLRGQCPRRLQGLSASKEAWPGFCHASQGISHHASLPILQNRPSWLPPQVSCVDASLLVLLTSSTRPCATLVPTPPDPALQLARGIALSFHIPIRYILLLGQLFDQRKHSYPAQRQASQMMLEPRGPSNSTRELKTSSENLKRYPRRSTASSRPLVELPGS